ncbi:glucosamine inositolphosphorylceramide transferase family protein [Rhizobium oryzicola]|uniref:Glucosamine inositolphosphorylceramide transferase 1 N-terminal domain-containing protein n=1 Tax=Rhizobium oryzicola TaxID=1232668 RepID=A0ABT8SWJ8_9HYPH|nr:hypothetical protein [Rhizobium oryzicola]MDO1582789.1 hypothetical protein [Rhizobium oryzicola]
MKILLKVREGLNGSLITVKERLEAVGHSIHLERSLTAPHGSPLARFILALEDKILWSQDQNIVSKEPAAAFQPDLIIDLTNEVSRTDIPRMTIEINGHTDFATALASVKTKSRHADVVVLLDGRAIASGRPMMTRQAYLSKTRDELNAAVETILLSAVVRLSAGHSETIVHAPNRVQNPSFLLRYIHDFADAAFRRIGGQLSRNRRPFYWKTAWRLTNGATLTSHAPDTVPTLFNELGDDGARFYADPFPFEYMGRTYVFLEEFPYQEGKGVISVTELGEDGSLSPPRVILREDHHLSYPNVFEDEGSIFMIPESGSIHEVVLYRAEKFPDRWVRDCVLIRDHNINDATLVRRDGRYWMFATEKIGKGSASDTLVVFSATQLKGPWLPHKLNPILIDKSGARPGGHVIQEDERLFLPVQDGSEVYGGGLGMREILCLDDENVILGNVIQIQPGSAWSKKGIHTYNRCGLLEVVDSTW